jgi:hypothetical protein
VVHVNVVGAVIVHVVVVHVMVSVALAGAAPVGVDMVGVEVPHWHAEWARKPGRGSQCSHSGGGGWVGVLSLLWGGVCAGGVGHLS